MATKVMLATAIARRETTREESAPRPAAAGEKRKRRRSSVYDADGNEVFITLMCLKCHSMRPLSQFGLRRMADGAIRNQPWCRGCRGGAGAEEGGRKRGRAREDLARAGAAPPVGARGETSDRVLDAGTLAAQVVAALQGGRR